MSPLEHVKTDGRYRKFGIKKDVQPIGGGGEKWVFDNDFDEKKVTKVLHPDGLHHSAEWIKSEYFLTKILHALFPEYITDIHLVASDPKVTVHNKVHVNNEHRILRDAVKKQLLGETIPDSFLERDEEITSELYNNPSVEHFNQQLNNLGIYHEANGLNIAVNSSGNSVYLDSIYPWTVLNEDEFILNFDPVELWKRCKSFHDKKIQIYFYRLIENVVIAINKYNQPNSSNESEKYTSTCSKINEVYHEVSKAMKKMV